MPDSRRLRCSDERGAHLNPVRHEGSDDEDLLHPLQHARQGLRLTKIPGNRFDALRPQRLGLDRITYRYVERNVLRIQEADDLAADCSGTPANKNHGKSAF